MAYSPILVYRRRYNFGFPGLARLHPFDMRKFAHAMASLRRRGMIKRGMVARPAWPSDAVLQQVHWRRYLKSVKSPAALASIVEVPAVARLPSFAARYALLNPMRWAVGGTILASELALRRELAVNLGGGFHHAHANFGHGFCVYSDVGIAIAQLRAKKLARRFLIVDLDAHQGDGHSTLFLEDDEVQILDMYNSRAFPANQQARDGITWNIPLLPGTRDDEYLTRLRETLPRAIEESRPDLVYYLAGTDIVAGDPLGMLAVSADGVATRDRYVLDLLRRHAIPTVYLTAGGYTAASAELISTTIEQVLRRSER